MCGWGWETGWTGTGRDEGPANHYDPQLIDLFGAGDCSPEANVLQGAVFFGSKKSNFVVVAFNFGFRQKRIEGKPSSALCVWELSSTFKVVSNLWTSENESECFGVKGRGKICINTLLNNAETFFFLKAYPILLMSVSVVITINLQYIVDLQHPSLSMTIDDTGCKNKKCN